MELRRSFSNVELLKINKNFEPQASNSSERQFEMQNGPQGSRVDSRTAGDGGELPKVDFVLVYVGGEAEENAKKITRERYERNLERRGLQLEPFASSEHDNLYFVKVYAPKEVLLQKAEDMNIQMPMKKELENPNISQTISSEKNTDVLEECHRFYEEHLKAWDPFTLAEQARVEEYTKIAFSKANAEAFDLKEGFYFDNAERSRMVHRILQLTSHDKEEGEDSREYEEEEDDNSREGGHGIEELCHHRVYEAYYPLHDGPLLSRGTADENDRQRLQEEWASLVPSIMFKYQPLDNIRKYCGVRVSFYFAWLGLYNCFLVPAAFVGVVCFVYALLTLESFEPLQEICDPSNEKLFYMCPQCDRHCSFYSLTSTCVYSRVARLFDNGATVFFSVFMSIWATLFLEHWKRKEASLAFKWDVFDLLKDYEPLRPEFVVKVKTKKENEVTKKSEPYIPKWTRIRRILSGFGVVCTMVMIVIGVLVGIIVYRASVLAAFYANSNNGVRENAKLVTSFTAATINLLCIQLLTQIYYKIAVGLTKWENPRTVTAFHNSFTLKMYVFEFVNTYSSLFYVAFFQSSLINGNPVKYRRISGRRIEECHPSGCLIDVCIQLLVIMVGKQLLRFLSEFVYPTIRKRWSYWRRGLGNLHDNERLPQWEVDYLLSQEIEFRMFHEYLDMVIQFGFVTMFVASFPLAPVFALINNIIELRSDAINFVVNYRRRVAEQVRNIGIWFKILKILTIISVLVNSFVIAFTTEFIPRLVYHYAYSPDNSLRGYVNNSLTFIKISDLEQSSLPDDPYKNLNYTLPYCRFKEYVEPQKPYDINKQFLYVMLVRIVFVIVFQYFVFSIKYIISWLVPDVPSSLKTQIRRKVHVARMCFRRYAVEAIKESTARAKKRRTRDLLEGSQRSQTDGKIHGLHHLNSDENLWV